jgi:predicted GNAT superfamily acetyltransferase
MHLRDLTSLDDFASVVSLQREIWGTEYDDVVPLSMLAVAVKRGGILVGAFDPDGGLAGFCFSVPGFKHGRSLQWSHMLAVRPMFRGAGLGYRLKLDQRDRTLARALDLVEWTYDPLLVTNAHLNVTRLGVVVDEYLENVYGASTSPLHHGAPTDRFVAAWYVASVHVRRRLEAGPIVARDARAAQAPTILSTRPAGEWRAPAGEPPLDRDDPRVVVEIPAGFGKMLGAAPDLAREWRAVTRRTFQTYFARGYRVVDFMSDRATGRAGYLLQRRT